MKLLPLPAELSIYTAAELHPLWLARADRDAGVEALADGTAVVQVDGAGVQLLMTLQHCLAARGRKLRLLTPSRPLREACIALGLDGWLAGLQTPEAAEAA